jgi:F-type H+-transporting ATPase subunit alpha
VVAIFAGVRGYLDKVDVGRIGAFESQLLSDLKSREPSVMEAIRSDLEIKPDTEKKLTGFLDNFAKSFS